MKSRSEQIRDLVSTIEVSGMPGLLRTVARWVDPEGPSADCIQAADNDMDSAVGAEQYYDAALGMAACLRASVLDPAPVEPDPGQPEEPEPGEPEPGPDRGDDLGLLVLAALLAQLKRATKT